MNEWKGSKSGTSQSTSASKDSDKRLPDMPAHQSPTASSTEGATSSKAPAEASCGPSDGISSKCRTLPGKFLGLIIVLLFYKYILIKYAPMKQRKYHAYPTKTQRPHKNTGLLFTLPIPFSIDVQHTACSSLFLFTLQKS